MVPSLGDLQTTLRWYNCYVLIHGNENVEGKGFLVVQAYLYLNVYKTWYIAETIIDLREHHLNHSPVTIDGTSWIVTFLEAHAY